MPMINLFVLFADCRVWGEWSVTDSAGGTVATDRDEFGRLRFKTERGKAYRLELQKDVL